MTLFKYKVLDKDRRTIKGLVDAATENAAADVLRDKGFDILYLEESSTISSASMLNWLIRVRPKDLVIFSRQFAVLISANIAMVEALNILVDQTNNRKLKKIMKEVTEEVDGGSRLSDALAKRPTVFSNFFVSVVRSGESSGKLDDVLTYLADEMEKDYDMLAKIKGAMIYPAFIICGMIGVGIFMMISVVPKMTEMMVQSGAQLPISTRILVWSSDFLINYWYIVSAGAVFLFVGFKVGMKNKEFKNLVDMVKLKMPIFGKLFTKIYLVRFSRSLNMLIVSGVSIVDSLRITADVVSNNVFSQLISETIKEVEDGNSISTVFATSAVMPSMVSQMLSIGEETGRLDMILNRLTEFYGREVNNMLANLMSIMEPLIMVVMGVAVGIMVAAVILPMYNMATNL